MKFDIFAIAITLGLASANNWESDLSKAASAANRSSQSVDKWSARNGLLGASGIQGYYPTMSSAIVSLSNDVNSLQDSDVNTGNVNAFVSNVVGLLDALTKKAGDFNSVGAGSIAENDLKGLTDPSVKIVSGLVSVLEKDCKKYDELTSALTAIDGAFKKAASAYTVSAPSFPDAGSCK